MAVDRLRPYAIFQNLKMCFVCGGGERGIAKSHTSTCFFFTKTLKHKYYLCLADEEVNFREVNNNMLCLLPNT